MLRLSFLDFGMQIEALFKALHALNLFAFSFFNLKNLWKRIKIDIFVFGKVISLNLELEKIRNVLSFVVFLKDFDKFWLF